MEQKTRTLRQKCQNVHESPPETPQKRQPKGLLAHFLGPKCGETGLLALQNGVFGPPRRHPGRTATGAATAASDPSPPGPATPRRWAGLTLHLLGLLRGLLDLADHVEGLLGQR